MQEWQWRYAKITWMHRGVWRKQFVRHTSRTLALSAAYEWATENIPKDSQHRASVRILRTGEIPDGM